jgi:hypothetical protein
VKNMPKTDTISIFDAASMMKKKVLKHGFTLPIINVFSLFMVE